MKFRQKVRVCLVLGIIFASVNLIVMPSANASCDGALKLAYQGPLSGPEAALGEFELSGVKFALKKSGLTNVQLIEIDDQGDPAIASKLAPSVASNDCLIGLVGPAYSGASRVSLPLYFSSRLPTITPSATNPTLFDYGKDIFHRAVLLDDFQGPAVAKLISAHVANPSVYLIGDSSDYSNQLRKSVEFSLGSKVIGKEDVNYSMKNFTAVIDRVINSGANTLYFSGYFSQASEILRALRLQSSTIRFVGSDGSVDTELIRLVGVKYSEGALFTSPAVPFDVADPILADEFKRVMKIEPGVYTAESYDAAMFFLEGIRNGNTTRIQLLNYINTNSFKGITKILKFDSRGELFGADVATLGIKGGQFVRASELLATQEPVKPTQPVAPIKTPTEEKSPVVISGSATSGSASTRSTEIQSLPNVATSKVKAQTKTIQCIKGKVVKKVSGVNPKCPTGYKVKS